MKRILVFALVLVLTITFLAGCFRHFDDQDSPVPAGGGTGPRVPQLEYSGTLKPETFVQQDSTVFTFPPGVDPASGSANVTMTLPASESVKITVGSILVGYNTEGGFIRRVTAVTDTQTNGTSAIMTLTTESALLQDAFSEIKVGYTGLLSQAVVASRRLLEASNASGTPEPNAVIKASILTSMVQGTLRQAHADLPFAGGNVAVEADVNFDPDVDFAFDYSASDGLKVFRLVFTGDLDGTVKITGTCDSSLEKTWEKELIHWETPFFVGPVAGSIEVSVPVGFTVAAGAKGTIMVGQEFGYRVRVGATYSPETDWQYLNERTTTRSQRLFSYEIEGQVGAEAYVAVSCAVKLLGALGPKAELKAFVTLATEWANQAFWELNGSIKAGIAGSVGLILKVWVVTLGEWNYELFNFETTLWEDQIPFYGRLSGRLLDDADSWALGGVSIAVQREGSPEFVATSSSDGWFFMDAAPGPSTVTCKHDGFEDLVWETDDVSPYMVFSYAFSNTVHDQGSRRMKRATPTVQGLIVDKTALPNPTPISDAKVVVKRAGVTIASATTGIDGRFSVICDRDGDVELEFSHTNFETHSRSHVITYGSVSDLRIELQIRTGTLTGSIKDSQSEQALSNATVRIMLGTTEIEKMETDLEGKFRFPDLEARTYSIILTLDEYVEKTVSAFSVVPGVETVCNETLSKTITARYVKDLNGIITDNETNLQWYETSENDTWFEHVDRVASLGVDGGGWRQASTAEIRPFLAGFAVYPNYQRTFDGQGILSVQETWASDLYPYDIETWNNYRGSVWFEDANWRLATSPIEGNLAVRTKPTN
ncbi:MAG: carboxypeptidase-like regulatory domain-containing protein [Candidatus Riflebacteria bacterium]|nr:carboxypeptidase-like regulatory domain-containing protein [Candidatus Riflebacteria bacterium]